MASLNKVQIIGRLGKDPELKYFPNGDAICNLTVATSETWKDKTTGEKKEATEWHKVVLERKLAEIAGQYLKKGSQAYFEGKIRTRKWKDKEGKEHYVTEIKADEMQMLDKRESGNEPSESGRPARTNGDGGNDRSRDDQDNDTPF